MPATPFDVYVFDFDGTLVDSAGAKRQAFFDIFTSAQSPAVEAVLAADPDASRDLVVPKMLEEIARRKLPPARGDVAAYIAAYGDRADKRASISPELPGASALLTRLADHAAIYVASATPHERLVEHITKRAWRARVTGVFGYPANKADVVGLLLKQHGISSSRLLVVGDGISDAEAAAANGCRFHRINSPSDLAAVAEIGTRTHV